MSQLNVEQLLLELSVPEKISLLAGKDFWHTAPVERLNIPSVRVSDGPNGVRGTKFFNGVPSNCFPCGTGMAATFNKELLVEAGELMGVEAKLKGAHCILGPTCNIVRNPLGGRAFESYSEDPLLSGHAASHIIRGIQNEKVMACIKHFVCNDQEHERKSVDTLVTERALREIYLKPFEIAFRDAKPRALMTAYNKVNGEHVSQSKRFLHDILRKEWGFDGLVMSDWFGVFSTKAALDAGLNLEMPGPPRMRLESTVSHGIYSREIHEDVIDDNVRRVLNFVNEGLAIGIPPNAVESPNEAPEASELLRRIGDESIVLLKNEGDLLPLSKSASKGHERIAVIGPNAKATQYCGGGSASLATRYRISPYEGIMKKIAEAGDTITVDYALGAFLDVQLPDIGCSVTDLDGKMGITAKFYTKAPGEEDRGLINTMNLTTSRVFLSDFESTELTDNSSLFYVDLESTFVPDESGTYDVGCSTLGTAQIFINNQLVVDNKTKQVKGDAFFLGMGTREERGQIHLEKGEKYAIRVEFGSGRTYTLSQENTEHGGVFFGIARSSTKEAEIARAVEIAKDADKVILCIGLSNEWESEGFDRSSLEIPGHTNDMVSAVAAVNRNVIVVNQSGSAVAFPWLDEVQAIIQAWYGGNELGNTIADILFGDYNPSGKLSVTFPKKIQDCPAYLNFGSTNGRVLYGEDVYVGYRYYEKVGIEPMFPFGFGLSYTSFEFGNLCVTCEDEMVKVTVDVQNTGKSDGAETVRIYVQQEEPTISRPFKELRDFAKVFVKAGESKTVKVALSIKEATSFWNEYKNSWESQKGRYKILAGNSSNNILAKGEFCLV